MAAGAVMVTAPSARAVVASKIEFGFPMSGVSTVQSAGADLGYGSYWVGYWMNTSGWGGLRSALDTAKANGVTPMIQWYYWGDSISTTCVENENPGLCGGKTKSNWYALAQTLANEIYDKMQGAPAVVVVEKEFDKGGIGSYEAFDGYLRDHVNIMHGKPGIKTAIGFGNWDAHEWGNFDRAMAVSDYAATMILFSCIRQTLTEYRNAVEDVITNANTLTGLFGKPIFVEDFSTSSYWEGAGDPAYRATDSNYQCRTPGVNYETQQELEVQEIFSKKQDLKNAGVFAWAFRALEDDSNRPIYKDDGVSFRDHHKIAERWFGFKHNGTAKAAYNDVIAGIQAENGSAPPPPQPGNDWRQEAEAFATRTTGGSCTSSTASGGACWNLWSNGSISTTTSSITAGSKKLTVVALGDPAGGVWPEMEVFLDGVKVMDLAVSDDLWLPYAAAVNVTAGTHTVQVSYTNDGSVDGNDRNLLVDVAMIDPAAASWSQEAEIFPVRTAGGLTPSTGASGSAYWNLWSNGHIETSMTVPYTSQHQVEVMARGDVAAGVWPIMKVYVDGVLALTQTVATTTWTSYRFTRTISGGSHTLRIEFTNDAMVNGEDRNLKLDIARLYS